MGGEPISVNGKLQTPAGSTQDALGGTALLETPTVNTVLGGTASIGSTPTPSSTTTLGGTVSLAAAVGGFCLCTDLICMGLLSVICSAGQILPAPYSCSDNYSESYFSSGLQLRLSGCAGDPEIRGFDGNDFELMAKLAPFMRPLAVQTTR